MTSAELRAYCTRKITELVVCSPENSLQVLDERAWDSPLVGVASGVDPLFKQYQTLIGEFYWTPVEVMRLAYPGEQFLDVNLSVICWILPQTAETVSDQRSESTLPAKRWIYSRYFGELFNEHLRRSLCEDLKAQGIRASAPVLLKDWGYRHSEAAGICSNWSERHTAYAAGLGTFGLSDGFITERGKAVRIGSIIIDRNIPPDQRSFSTHTQNCLFLTRGTCGACIRRCPAAAIAATGHDKQRCHDYIRQVTSVYAKQVSGKSVTPCGLCQVKVPCENHNPMKR